MHSFEDRDLCGQITVQKDYSTSYLGGKDLSYVKG